MNAQIAIMMADSVCIAPLLHSVAEVNVPQRQREESDSDGYKNEILHHCLLLCFRFVYGWITGPEVARMPSAAPSVR